ncbi:phosphoribosyltransferase-like protein [Plantibacter sp. CFBP 8775]|uniref:phosphoribosyltransferase-like protein n=1 Tax=Plantibacter sp. CFBP 8775 TaxID=2774038 RepID=UPI0017858760|nr:hypothetical protein [Plantibacter sp. CFBP 8775]MBD8103217.1 hypothetical protein [Plantibacter sp. CFBP 8775]
MKYDEYEGYSPAVKFLESLATWLTYFDQEDRRIALTFILERLTFISSPELDHLVGTVYPDVLRPYFIRKAAESLPVEPWRVGQITATQTFREIQRRTLIMGMSDGARLDKLRRASSMSTEQFHLVSVIDGAKQADLKKSLRKALDSFSSSEPATFTTVVVVDDFTASGTTMLRRSDPATGQGDSDEPTIEWEGKLVKLDKHLEQLREHEIIDQDAEVIVLIYLMTQQAKLTLDQRMSESGFASKFQLRAVHTFGDELPLDDDTDADFLRLCDKYFQEEWVDEHNRKAGDPRLGFGGSRLPLILHHNAPNNTPPIVWKEHDSQDKKKWSGVFPRHERHSSERP